jgi:hypothetical protein
VEVYVNGALDVTAPESSTSIPDCDSDLYLGTMDGEYARAYAGLIDDVRIYRRALGREEVALLAGAAAGTMLASAGPPTRGLVGHWRFDEAGGAACADSSGGGTDGELHAGPDPAAARAGGRFGGALRLDPTDGTAEYVKLGESERLNFSKDFTISAWIKPEELSGVQAIVSKIEGNTHRPYVFQTDGGRLKFCNTYGYNVFDVAGGRLTKDWQHVAVTMDDALNVRLYVDGREVASATATRDAKRSEYPVIIGTYGGKFLGQGDAAFHGLIDEVRIYGRALAPAEVASLARASEREEYVAGLTGEYFEGHDFDPAKLRLTRVDRSLDFEWGRGKSPGPGVPENGFAVRWTGEILVPSDGAYEFRLHHDDDARLWVDGKLIGNWRSVGRQDRATIDLKAGWVPLKVELLEKTVDAVARLYWSGTGTAEAIVAAEQLRTRRPAAVSPAASAVATAGGAPGPTATTRSTTRAGPELPGGPKKPLPGETGKPGQWSPGLIAEIFQGTVDTGKRIGVRIDPAIDFAFGRGPPDLDAPEDGFSIRWSGWLLVPFDGQYSFTASGNDRLEVNLDGKHIAASKSHKSGTSLPLELEAGLHTLTATLTESRDDADARLSWIVPGRRKSEAIPPDHYFHEVPELGSMGPFARLVQGVWAEYYSGANLERKVSEGRVDRIDYDVGSGPPCTHPLCPKDRFSVRLKGYVFVRSAGSYESIFDFDEGVRMTIDGKPVIDHWGKGRPQEPVKTPRLDLGVGFHEFVLEHQDISGDAKLGMRWTTGTMHHRAPSENDLYYEPLGASLIDRRGLAPGLVGTLYESSKPGTVRPAQKRIDASLWFRWGTGAPAPGITSPGYSGVWNGVLLAPATGEYTFRVKHAGGVTFHVGSKAVIKRWTDREGEQDGSVRLRAGGKVPIKFSFFHEREEGDKTSAGTEVYWSGPNFGMRRLRGGFLGNVSSQLPVARPWTETAASAVAPPVGRKKRVKRGAKTPSPPPSPRPAPRPEEAAPELPKGNRILNGGFEILDRRTSFARGWNQYNWGRKSARGSVRVDRVNAHGGEQSVVVRAIGEGAKPGAFTSIALVPAKYELRYWATADVAEGETAEVRADVAGEALPADRVGPDWTQFKHTVSLQEKKAGANVRLWVETPRVRVWFDDVELEAVGPAEPPDEQ